MRSSKKTLGVLITISQTATTRDIPLTHLKQHSGMFQVIQGKIGLKAAREWLLGIAILEQINSDDNPSRPEDQQ